MKTFIKYTFSLLLLWLVLCAIVVVTAWPQFYKVSKATKLTPLQTYVQVATLKNVFHHKTPKAIYQDRIVY